MKLVLDLPSKCPHGVQPPLRCAKCIRAAVSKHHREYEGSVPVQPAKTKREEPYGG